MAFVFRSTDGREGKTVSGGQAIASAVNLTDKKAYKLVSVSPGVTPQHEGKYVIPSLGVRVYTTEPGEDGRPKAVYHDLKTLPVSFDADNFHYETHKAYGT